MEGKGVLFQKFAGIDVFDLEIAENDPDKLVEIIAALEPTFGGINLEDIKAPECFEVEAKLRERMNIPVFHDDQHGTAIIVGAALVNALHVLGKPIGEVTLAASGAGAAGLACLDMLVSLGVKPENISVADKDGVLYAGRPNLDASLTRYARDTASAHARGHRERRRRLPRPVRRRRAEAGDGGHHGRAPGDLRARQSLSGNRPARGQGGAAGRDHRHRTLRISRTRSTTRSAFPTSSAARSTSAPPRSPRR